MCSLKADWGTSGWVTGELPSPTAHCPICSLIGRIFERFVQAGPCHVSCFGTIFDTGDMELHFRHYPSEYMPGMDANEIYFQVQFPGNGGHLIVLTLY